MNIPPNNSDSLTPSEQLVIDLGLSHEERVEKAKRHKICQILETAAKRKDEPEVQKALQKVGLGRQLTDLLIKRTEDVGSAECIISLWEGRSKDPIDKFLDDREQNFVAVKEVLEFSESAEGDEQVEPEDEPEPVDESAATDDETGSDASEETDEQEHEDKGKVSFYVSEIRKLVEANNLQEALDLVLETLKDHPNAEVLYLDASNIAEKMGKKHVALDLYKKLAALTESDPMKRLTESRIQRLEEEIKLDESDAETEPDAKEDADKISTLPAPPPEFDNNDEIAINEQGASFVNKDEEDRTGDDTEKAGESEPPFRPSFMPGEPEPTDTSSEAAEAVEQAFNEMKFEDDFVIDAELFGENFIIPANNADNALGILNDISNEIKISTITKQDLVNLRAIQQFLQEDYEGNKSVNTAIQAIINNAEKKVEKQDERPSKPLPGPFNRSSILPLERENYTIFDDEQVAEADQAMHWDMIVKLREGYEEVKKDIDPSAQPRIQGLKEHLEYVKERYKIKFNTDQPPVEGEEQEAPVMNEADEGDTDPDDGAESESIDQSEAGAEESEDAEMSQDASPADEEPEATDSEEEIEELDDEYIEDIEEIEDEEEDEESAVTGDESSEATDRRKLETQPTVYFDSDGNSSGTETGGNNEEDTELGRMDPRLIIAQIPAPEKISALNIDEPLTVEEGKHIQLPIAMTGDKITVKNNAAVTIGILTPNVNIQLNEQNSFVVIGETSKECGDNPVEIIVKGKGVKGFDPVIFGPKASREHISVLYSG